MKNRLNFALIMGVLLAACTSTITPTTAPISVKNVTSIIDPTMILTPTASPNISLTVTDLGTPYILCEDNFASYEPGMSEPNTTPPSSSEQIPREMMSPNQEFIKTWKIKNIGTCAWNEKYRLIFSFGEKMYGQAIPLESVVEPGQDVNVSVKFRAPNKIGEYLSAWVMTNSMFVPFGRALYVIIIVK